MARTDVREIVVPAVLKEIDRVRRFLKDYVAGLGLDEEDSLKVELALHEICVNVAMYAYPEEPHGEMAVRLWREDGILVIEVRDKGVPFNPVKKKNPDLLVKLRRGPARRSRRLFLPDADGRPVVPADAGRERPNRPQGPLISRGPCPPR